MSKKAKSKTKTRAKTKTKKAKTPKREWDAYLRRHPGTRYLDAFVCDLSCVMRGKRFPVHAAGKVFEGGMMLPGSSFLLSASGESHDPEGMGFSDGDPDEVARPIEGALAPAPWAREPGAQVMLTLGGLDGAPYYFEPRNVLARVLARFAELRLRPVVAFELEFYLLDAAQGAAGASGGARETQVYSIDQVEECAAYLHEVMETCARQGIATGAISAEYAPGQFEINLPHTDAPLAAADQCVLFRRAVQCVARKHGMRATFMAKPRADSSGSGLHLHISLLDKRGRNIFDGGEDPRSAPAPLLHALGGLLKLLPESMAVLAPNINSYRRFRPDIYVPVSPSWGFENRSVALRIPKSAGASRRIEHRVAGADANPYLALAALLAGIHHGLVARIDPGEPARGNAGARLDPSLPFEPEAAFAACRGAPVLSEYFGARYLRAYAGCKLNEYRAFVKSGRGETDWYL